MQNTEPNRVTRTEPEIDAAHQQLRDQLEQKLLSLGGKRVIWRAVEPDLPELLERGQLFAEPVKLRRGRQGGCHENAAKLWAKDVHRTRLLTGYGLSDDGLWRQHSWVVQKGVLLETTRKRTLYFGIALDPEPALKFWFENYANVYYWNEQDYEWIGKYPGPLAIVKQLNESSPGAA